MGRTWDIDQSKHEEIYLLKELTPNRIKTVFSNFYLNQSMRRYMYLKSYRPIELKQFSLIFILNHN